MRKDVRKMMMTKVTGLAVAMVLIAGAAPVSNADAATNFKIVDVVADYLHVNADENGVDASAASLNHSSYEDDDIYQSETNINGGNISVKNPTTCQADVADNTDDSDDADDEEYTPSCKPVQLQKPAICGAKRGKGQKVRFSLKKIDENADGIEIRYSKNSRMTKCQTKKVSSTERNLTVNKFSRNKNYYAQVRTYQYTDDGIKYSKWSAKKKVFIRK